MFLDYSLLKAFRPQIEAMEKAQIDFMTEGWNPDVALEPGQDHPLINWFGVRFEEFLHPMLFYVLLLIFGYLTIRPNRRMLPENVIYMLKFFYNFIQIFVCSYMSLEALMLKLRNGWSLIPFSPDRCAIMNAQNPVLGRLIWLFYMTKILDFADTFFIIVNGKVRQFSFLHCYHHLSIYYAYFLVMHSYYDGDAYIPILVNGFVHAVMYTYYLISLHTSPNKITVWWKKYVTKIQLSQFVSCLAHAFFGMMNCKAVNMRTVVLYSVYQVIMYLLFTQFYQGAYKKKPGAKNDSVSKNAKVEDRSKPKKH